MKYIKKFENLYNKDSERIAETLLKYGIDTNRCKIHADGTVDVDTNINLVDRV